MNKKKMEQITMKTVTNDEKIDEKFNMKSFNLCHVESNELLAQAFILLELKKESLVEHHKNMTTLAQNIHKLALEGSSFSKTLLGFRMLQHFLINAPQNEKLCTLDHFCFFSFGFIKIFFSSTISKPL